MLKAAPLHGARKAKTPSYTMVSMWLLSSSQKPSEMLMGDNPFSHSHSSGTLPVTGPETLS